MSNNNHTYPIVKPTVVGKTHYLRVESNDPTEIEAATKTLCNVDRAHAPVMTQEGVQTTCKRCLKLAELNAARESNLPPAPTPAPETINGVKSTTNISTSLPSVTWNIPF